MSGNNPLTILLVEDSASDALILEEHLKDATTGEYRLLRYETRMEAVRYFESGEEVDIVLFDLTLPDSKGVEGLKVFLDLINSAPVVVLTGSLDESVGEAVLSVGAQDFVMKDELSGSVVWKSIRFAMERHRLMQRQMDLQARVSRSERQQAMATLAAGLAHDIGNMLTPVVMASELGLLTSNDPQIKELFEEVRNSSRSASELARQLMAMKSPESASELRVVGFRESIDLAINLVKRTIPPKIQLDVSVDSESLRELKVAVGLTDLQQILINLVTNSIHALGNREDGRIQVMVTFVETSGRIQVSVSDNGPGFRKGALENAFQAFFTTKKSKGGTGLGLAMCTQIIERLEGEISARNIESGGAEVSFWLPVAQEISDEALDESVLGARPGLRKVLFIDDNEIIASRTKNVLELLGYLVTISTDTEGALKDTQWEDSPYDVVILDYAMPGLNGMGMARKLRECSPSLPIVFATAYADLLSSGEIEAIGNSKVVAKPFDVRELIEAMRASSAEFGQMAP